MMLQASDWQAVVVALVVLAAILYVARRAFARLRSFSARGRGSMSDCATGCGKCGDDTKAVSKPLDALVQIDSQRTPRRRA